MKIANIVKKTKQSYEIKLEKGSPFLILDETILKYNLYKGKEISLDELEDIKNYNNVMKYYIKCVNKINYKKRTKMEIILFLKNEDISKKDISIIIEKLEKTNLLNDSNYIKAFINDEINLTLNGPYKIKTKLYKKGFNDSDINNVLKYIDDDVWQDKINKLIIKKIKCVKTKSAFEVKTKIINDLLKEGFDKTDVLSYINNYQFTNDCNVLEKQYNKLLRKYQNKDLSEAEKTYLIKQELYKKGYKEEEINKTIN